jgi:hypothetical protein
VIAPDEIELLTGRLIDAVDAVTADLVVDGIKNGAETDVDCGGPDCPKCPDGKGCAAGSDCQSGFCVYGICQPAT